MTFLPIAERELRVRARHKGTFRVRVGAALVAVLIIAFFLTSAAWSYSPAKSGQAVFWFVSGLAFLWCLFEGPRNTADALSEEKREGTLGLLFLTDLKGYDVVFGKLLATSLNSFYGVLAILPPLSIPLLLGGVTLGEFWRMVLLLLVTLVFSLSTGLLVSSSSRNERNAWTAAVGILAFLAAVPPLFRWMPLPSAALLGICSPTPAFYSLADTLFSRQPQTYWYSVSGVSFLSFAFLIAACLVLPRSWQDKAIQKANLETRSRQRLHVGAERRQAMPLNPAVWMLTRGRRDDVGVWLLVSLFAVPSLVITLIWSSVSVLVFPFILGAVIVNFILAIWVSAKACFMIADAKSSGALDMLMTTPISPNQIIDAHLEALKRQFMEPFLVLSICEVVVVAVLDIRGKGYFFPVVITPFAAGLMAAQLMAAGWFGLWAGLTTKKSAHAVVKTILWVLVIPNLFIFLCSCLFPIVVLIKDAVLINYASTRLRQQFRNIITEGVPVKTVAWSRPASWPPFLPGELKK